MKRLLKLGKTSFFSASISRNIMKVAVFLPYEYDSVPSQRFRWEQWEPRFAGEGIAVTRIHFLTPQLAKLRDSGNGILFTFLVLLRYCSWIVSTAFKIRDHDLVIVHRNAALAGPPLLEMLLLWLKKVVVYDLDDAVYLPPEGRDNIIRKLIRCDWRVKAISKRAEMVGVGNVVLADYVAEYSSKITENVD